MPSTQPTTSLLISGNVSSNRGISEPIQTQPCAICRRNFSKYTCPSCNAPYCSLQCYRSESHSQCTEPFYRKQIELEIKAEPNKSTEEKKKMMELLKRFEEESHDAEEAEDDSDDDVGVDNLSKQLEGIDIDSIPTSELWSLLSSSQRTKFLKTLQNPDSELVKDLLSSEAITKSISLPWWEPGERKAPRLIEVPPSLLTKNSIAGKSLIHNIFALTLTYAYIIRTYGVSILQVDAEGRASGLEATDHQSIMAIISKVVPFLTDRKSTVAHAGVDTALTDVVSRLTSPGNKGDPGVTISPTTIKLLLHDCTKLLTPDVIVPHPDNFQDQNSLEFSQYRKILLVLSDLSNFFQHQQQGKMSYAHITHKLAFYCAHVASSPSASWILMLDVIKMKARELEARDEAESSWGVGENHGSRKVREHGYALIHELS